MKITDYEKITQLVADNIFLLDGPDGTKTMKADVMAQQLLNLLTDQNIMKKINMKKLAQQEHFSPSDLLMIGLNSDGTNRALNLNNLVPKIIDAHTGTYEYLRRDWFRGRFIGTSFTSEQQTAVANGTFENLFVGDFWTINGINWRIADFDYWLGKGDSSSSRVVRHHLVIVPDSAIINNIEMNISSTVDGGYVSSYYYDNTRDRVISIVQSAFPSSHILNTRISVVNATDTNGVATGYTFINGYVDFMNECQVYGTKDYRFDAFEQIDNAQFALFRIAPWFTFDHSNNTYWLRDVGSKTAFKCVRISGAIDVCDSHTQLTARPYFALA